MSFFASRITCTNNNNFLVSIKETITNRTETRLVGITYMDFLVEFLKNQRASGGKAFITGLDAHVSSSTYNRALKISLTSSATKLSQRQKRLRNLATERDYQYTSQVDWDTVYLKKFHFFEIRPIERKYNCLKGTFEGLDVSWEIADVTFNEGQAFTAAASVHPCMVVELPRTLNWWNYRGDLVLVYRSWYVFSGITLTYTFGQNPCFCDY